MTDNFRTIVADVMVGVKDELSHHVGVEVRAVVALQTDQLRDDIGSLHAIKIVAETCLSKVTDNGDFLNEIVESVNLTGNEVQSKIDTISQSLDTVKATQEAVTLARTQLSSISALLTENLKVCRL